MFHRYFSVSYCVIVSVDVVVAKCPHGIYVLMEETGKQNKYEMVVSAKAEKINKTERI